MMNQAPRQPMQPAHSPELFDNASEDKKNDMIHRFHLSGDAITRMVAKDGMWKVGDESAEKYFQDIEDLYSGNDNADLYKR